MTDVTTPLVDCISVIHLHLPLVSPEACVNARATIMAAEIQADAARVAGNQTLISGLLALFAALLAVIAAVADQLARRADHFRTKRAYFSRMLLLFDNVEESIAALKENFVINSSARMLPRSAVPNQFVVNWEVQLDLQLLSDLRDALSHKNWKEISLFPKEDIHISIEMGIELEKLIVQFTTIRDNSEWIHFPNGEKHRLTSRPEIIIACASAGLSFVADIRKKQDKIRRRLAPQRGLLRMWRKSNG